MKRKVCFWLLIGMVWLLNTAEVRSQETRGQSGNRQFNTAVTANAADFDRTYALAMDFAGKELFLGTDAGLFRSANGGRAWKKVFVPAKQATLNVTAVALDAKHPNALYVATREAGLFASADGGTKWSEINNGLGGLDAEGLTIDPNDGKLHAVIRAKQQGIFRSTNGGNKWDRVNGGPGQEINFLNSVNVPTGMGGIFLYAGTAEGLQRSPDCF